MGQDIESLRFKTKNETVVGSYQEFGLTGKSLGDAHGLVGGAATYYFKVNTVEYSIVVTSATTTFKHVLDLINAVLPQTKASYHFAFLTGGDIRLHTNVATTVLAAGSTGTDLFGAGGFNTTVDTQVSNFLMVIFDNLYARRISLNQIRILFPIAYTGTISWILHKSTTTLKDQHFISASLTAVEDYYANENVHTNLPIKMQSGDMLVFYSSAAIVGTIQIELGLFGTSGRHY